jgi:hypothetical protein
MESLPVEVLNIIVRVLLPDAASLRDVNRTFRDLVHRWEGPINELPPELVIRVITFLEGEDLNTIAQLSRGWAEAVYSRMLALARGNELQVLLYILEEELFSLVPVAFPRAGFYTYDDVWDSFEASVDDFTSDRFRTLNAILRHMEEASTRHPLSDEDRRIAIVSERLLTATRDDLPFDIEGIDVSSALADGEILARALRSGDEEWVRSVLDMLLDQDGYDPLPELQEIVQTSYGDPMADVVSEYLQ